MKKSHSLTLVAMFFIVSNSLNATTVIAPSFDELVSRAEVIFEGLVTDVRSQWVGEGAQRHIVTYVTFKVDDAIKGNPGVNYTLRMLGGTVDGETMEVSDSPKFQKGDRDILFIEHNGQQFVPLVGIMHGRFHVKREQDGRETVASNRGEQLTDVANLGKEEHVVAAEKAALSPVQFKAAIKDRIKSQAAKQP
jgi:hypothetical protein